jgi:hypothetical protein
MGTMEVKRGRKGEKEKMDVGEKKGGESGGISLGWAWPALHNTDLD